MPRLWRFEIRIREQYHSGAALVVSCVLERSSKTVLVNPRFPNRYKIGRDYQSYARAVALQRIDAPVQTSVQTAVLGARRKIFFPPDGNLSQDFRLCKCTA